MAENCIEFLRDYVAIPSVNPMGRADLDPAIVGERAYAEHVCAQVRALGLDAELIGDAERPSLVAEARAAGAGAGSAGALLVASHLDTVPVDGMEIPPFDPTIRDGRLAGRGSCDTKAGMAALVAALAEVLEAGTLRRHLILVGEADEELGSRGAHAVAEHVTGRGVAQVIATEPTELRVVTHHKGIVHARLEARGVACHSSAPDDGRNAIVALARGLISIEELRHALRDRIDPRLGSATLSIGVVGGGAATNIVPESAWADVDRRLLPGEDGASVRAEIEDALRRAGVADDVCVARCRVEKPPLGTPESAAPVTELGRVLGEHSLDPDPGVVAFGTDAGIFSERGIPSVVFGPGSIRQAHTSREFVPIAEVETATRIFRRLLETPLGE